RSKLVRSNAELIPAILAARPGDRVLLAAGAYERLGLQGVKVAGEVTIASADPGNRALVAGIELSDCRGLRFENMDLTVNARNLIAFNISNSDHIALEGLNIQDPAVKYSGVLIRDSSDVSVTG